MLVVRVLPLSVALFKQPQLSNVFVFFFDKSTLPSGLSFARSQICSVATAMLIESN